MRNYLKAANFYSYDATEDENPVMRWIGREVKRFIAEAHIHLPFLLRVAAAPPDLTEDMDDTTNGATAPARPCTRLPMHPRSPTAVAALESTQLLARHPIMCADDGEFELEADDELNVTEEEIAAEEEDEPTMMQNAKYWDDFIALVNEAQKPWAVPEDDTDEYRKQRAVDFFNVANVRAAFPALAPSMACFPPQPAQCPPLPPTRPPNLPYRRPCCGRWLPMISTH